MTQAMESADHMSAYLKNQQIILGGKQLNIMRINKVPLDLNQPSRVLLVTFIGFAKEITIDNAVKLFGTYGSIGKVVIYKKKNVQILVEMESIEAATTIRDDQEKISKEQNIKMKIQFTNKKNLIVEKNCVNEYDSKKDHQSAVSNKNSSKVDAFSRKSGGGQDNIFKSMKEKQNQNYSVDERNSFGSLQKLPYYPGSARSQKASTGIKRESDPLNLKKNGQRFQGDSHKRMTESLGRAQYSNRFGSRFSTRAGSESREEDKNFDRMILIQEVPEAITHDMIFNLCSLYGNIDQIWLHEEMMTSLVCYETAGQVDFACTSLNGLAFFDSQIKVKPASKETPISEMAMDGDEIDYKSNSNQRFKIPGSKNYNNMNPPSTTIHLSNLPENYDLSKIVELFEGVARPEQVTYFSGSKTMALANFETIAQATQVLVTFHNHNILSR